MREIKFRVWNIDEYISLNKAIHDDIVVIQQPSSSNDSLIEINWEGVELEQFTGMLDKHGVPIFEGDVIKDHIGIGVVEYSEKRASFRVNYKYGTCKWFIDYNLKGELESIEVIGNIHQHAHLLEQNKC